MLFTLIVFAAAIIITLLYVLGLKNTPQLRALFFKISGLVLIAVFAVRYLYRANRFEYITKLSAPESAGLALPAPLMAMSIIMIWMGLASILLTVLAPFFKIRTVDTLVAYISAPVSIINLIIFSVNARMLEGDSVFSGFNFRIILYGIETALCAALAFSYMWYNGKMRINKKELVTILLLIIPTLIVTMPIHLPKIFFGEGQAITINDINLRHRQLIYGSFILPAVLYFALRKRRPETKRFALIFISLATLLSFSSLFLFDAFLSPVTVPLHLCNTAMYIIPVCLIFKTKRLFYFTYFINVLGAFLAILMPNYGVLPATSPFMVNFWINHYIAFFMPFLAVSLGVFKRPSELREFLYSMSAFAVYFVAILFFNAWFSNYGTVDFFFLNSNFIVDKFPPSWNAIMQIKASFNIGELTFTFYPLFQTIFFLGYVVMSLGMWFLYENLYRVFARLGELHELKRKIRQDEIMLRYTDAQDKNSEPVNKDGKNMIKLINFSKKYARNKNYAVNNANLEIYEGEIFGFLGPNGAGKSTIIKSIVGLQPITDGRIEVCGYDVEKQSIQTKKLIGFVPDHYALYEKLTGREYINYIADIYGVNSGERNERIERFLEIFEFRHAFDDQVKTYSHGMKQKIAIMAALIHNPKVWILDEPLTGLDPNSIFQVKETMKEHAKKGNIVFFSSHIMDVVERLCDRIAIIRKGNIITTKKMSEVEKSGMSLEKYYLTTIATGIPPLKD